MQNPLLADLPCCGAYYEDLLAVPGYHVLSECSACGRKVAEHRHKPPAVTPPTPTSRPLAPVVANKGPPARPLTAEDLTPEHRQAIEFMRNYKLTWLRYSSYVMPVLYLIDVVLMVLGGVYAMQDCNKCWDDEYDDCHSSGCSGWLVMSYCAVIPFVFLFVSAALAWFEFWQPYYIFTSLAWTAIFLACFFKSFLSLSHLTVTIAAVFYPFLVFFGFIFCVNRNSYQINATDDPNVFSIDKIIPTQAFGWGLTGLCCLLILLLSNPQGNNIQRRWAVLRRFPTSPTAAASVEDGKAVDGAAAAADARFELTVNYA